MALRQVGARAPDFVAYTLLVGAAAWLFRLHLTGRALFIGNSDRLHHMLTTLSFYTESFRKCRLAAWNTGVFGGVDAVGQPFTFPNPLALVESLAGREHLFFVAGVGSCLLLAAAGCAAYAFIRDLSGNCFASLVGAILYEFTALTTLKVSQNDMSFAVIVTIPVMMLLLRHTRGSRLVFSFVGLSAFFGCLLTFMFLQKAAYALMLGGGYAIWLAVGRRDWRPVIVPGAAFLVGLALAFPRLYTVGEDMRLSRRGEALPYKTSAEYYRCIVSSSCPRYQILRWLDDGIFGRYVAEAASAGNNVGLNEGVLLYSSAFTVLVLAAGALRFRGRWLRLLLFRDGDVSYLLCFLLFGLAVVTVPYVHYLVYRLFFRWEFLHARILVACILPVCALIAAVLRDFVGERPEGLSRLATGLLFAGVCGLALVLLRAGDLVTRAGLGTWIDVLVDGQRFVPRLLGASVLHVGFALVVFVGLCVARAGAANRPAVRWALGSLLGLLLVLDAAASANFRVNGPQNRAGAGSLAKDSLLLADAHDFATPSEEARRAFASRLQTEHYRSVVVGSATQFPQSSAMHLAQFWGLRLVDGYLNAVPRDLAALPWPAGTCYSRSLLFPSRTVIPWHLFSLLNVKYAIVPNDALCLNRVATAGGGHREVSPADVTILQNPLPVVPRYFFAARAEPVASPEAAARNLITGASVADVLRTSYAEGLVEPRNFDTGGRLAVYGDGDRIDIAIDPADGPRFLVLNERFDPRWRAHAGATNVPIYRTNAVMRGLVVPPGVNHITMRFTPFVFSPRAMPFYGLGVFLFAAGGWLFRRLDRRPPLAVPAPTEERVSTP
jgi:hypothetical protein